MPTILIWNNNVVGGGHKVIGHAAMNLNDTWVSCGVDNDKNYVSWWPGDRSKETFGHEHGKRFGVAGNSFLEDLKDESGYAPDHVIRIDKSKLKLSEMQAKWNEIRTKDNCHYLGYRKNCATIVARVLRAGTDQGSNWHRHSMIWSPLKVKRFAFDIGGVELEWKSFVEEISTQISGPESACLRMLKRRSDKHGFSGAAAPRFQGGKDTGKFNPFDATYEHNSSGDLIGVNKPLLEFPPN